MGLLADLLDGHRLEISAKDKRIAELERGLLNSKESVKRNAYRIIERDNRIAELEKELRPYRASREIDSILGIDKEGE